MRFNAAHLYGMVCEAPIFVGDNSFALFRVAVIRADRVVEDGRNKNFCDVIKVMTRNPALIEKIKEQELRMLDMVDIEGIITTGNINKTARCPHCGGTSTSPGVIIFVQPKQIIKVKHVEDRNEAFQDLVEHRENSNQARILGTLCRDPKIGKTKSGITNSQYIIASDKLYREAGDDASATTNYPVVVDYGKNAQDAYKYLHQGSSVLIDGCIHARSIQRHMVCPHCGRPYDWPEEAAEIVPYHTSFVGNYYTDSDVDAIRQKKLEDIKGRIFGEQKNP